MNMSRGWGAGLVFVVVFGIYVQFLAPSISLIDSSEFITAAHCLGNAHSPGYPTYVLIGKLFSLLPCNCIPFRVNLASAFFAALTTALLYELLRRHCNHWAGMAGAAALAFSGAFWDTAEAAEVYAMAIAGLLGLLLLLHEGAQRPPRALRCLLAASLLTGLVLGVHQMVGFTAPALAYLLLRHYRAMLGSLRNLMLMLFFFFLGYSTQLHLPLRANAGAAYTYEMPVNAKRFFNLISTGTYHGQRFVRSQAAFDRSLHNYLQVVVEDFGVIQLLVAAAGFVWLLKRRHQLAIFLLLLWFSDTLIALVLFNIPDEWLFFVKVFYLPGYLAAAMSIGCFWWYLTSYRRYLALLIVPITLIEASAHYAAIDKSDYFLLYDWAVNVMSTAPAHALVIVQQDEPFALAYMQLVEKYRPDVTPVHFQSFSSASGWYRDYIKLRDPELMLPYIENHQGEAGEGLVLRSALSRLQTQRPLYMTVVEPRLAPDFRELPAGALYRIQAAGEQEAAPLSPFWRRLRQRGWRADIPCYERPEQELLAGYIGLLRHGIESFVAADRYDLATEAATLVHAIEGDQQ